MTLIRDLLRQGPTFSFEFFPPKDDAEQSRLQQTIAELQPLDPSFVSVTYRGGRVSRERTTSVVRDMQLTTSLTPMPHLTCVCHSRAELIEIVSDFREAGLENLLALGGDPVAGDEGSARELAHAIDLVELARSIGTESIGVAAHPNGHPSAVSREADRDRLAEKLRLADFAITQFFFHADEYLRLVDDLGARGVHQPVIAGVMPITNLRSISRMATLSGLSVPSDVTERLEPLEDRPEEFRRVGIEIATNLCRELLEAGVPGLHFYTLNFSKATREIFDSLAPVRIRPGHIG